MLAVQAERKGSAVTLAGLVKKMVMRALYATPEIGSNTWITASPGRMFGFLDCRKVKRQMLHLLLFSGKKSWVRTNWRRWKNGPRKAEKSPWMPKWKGEESRLDSELLLEMIEIKEADLLNGEAGRLETMDNGTLSLFGLGVGWTRGAKNKKMWLKEWRQIESNSVQSLKIGADWKPGKIDVFARFKEGGRCSEGLLSRDSR